MCSKIVSRLNTGVNIKLLIHLCTGMLIAFIFINYIMKNLLNIIKISFCLLLYCLSANAQNKAFEPGNAWNDTNGKPINAHGGGILYHKNTYYWYGEYKNGKTTLPEWATWECYRTEVVGVKLLLI